MQITVAAILVVVSQAPSQSRPVTLILVDAAGEAIGALERMAVDSPWWPQTEPIIRAARDQKGVEVTVLRLLQGDPKQPLSHSVYVAQVTRSVAAEPWSGSLDDHPLRLPWARPGGPAADISWAAQMLARQGLPLSGPPEQVRTWNLSSLWRLPSPARRSGSKPCRRFSNTRGGCSSGCRMGPCRSYSRTRAGAWSCARYPARTCTTQLPSSVCAWSTS